MKILKFFMVGAFLITLTGCPLEGDDGKVGDQGINGVDGIDGVDGINCWDSNEDGINDTNEDINYDGKWDVNDCTSSSPVSQTPEVELNHQHLCEAFANLGQYPAGCPSASHSAPVGSLTQMRPGTFFNDGLGNHSSCSLPPSNGILSIEPKNNSYYWVLKGGFIAQKSIVNGVDELANNVCSNNCTSDPNCVASYATVNVDLSSETYVCHKFYHSDTVSQWEHLCGKNVSECTVGLGNAQIWSSLCP